MNFTKSDNDNKWILIMITRILRERIILLSKAKPIKVRGFFIALEGEFLFVIRS